MSDFKNDIDKLSIDELLKKLPNFFEFSGDIYGMAYLNWRFDSFRETREHFFEMGNAYYETAMVLLDKCIDENADRKADVWIFPILFNTVHGIEVYLKGLNSQIETLINLENETKYKNFHISKGHNIEQLSDITAKRLTEFLSITKSLSEEEKGIIQQEIKFVKKFISLIYSKTNDMTFPRYPISSNKTSQMYVNSSENITIDLYYYKIWMYKVFSILEKQASYFEHIISFYQELLSEMAEYSYYY